MILDPKNRPKFDRRKRMALAALLGVLTGMACQFMPDPWRVPCAIGVKLIALLLGGSS